MLLVGHFLYFFVVCVSVIMHKSAKSLRL